MRGRPLLLFCLLFMAGIFLSDALGNAGFSGVPPSDTSLETLHEAMIAGEVSEARATDYSFQIILNNSYLITRSEQIPIEKCIAYTKEISTVPQGALVLLSGEAALFDEPRNPGEFDLRRYYRTRHINLQLKNAHVIRMEEPSFSLSGSISRLRAVFSGILSRAGGEEAAYFQSLLLGEKDEISKEAKQVFLLSGILHIFSISGLHISLLGMGLYRLLHKTALSVPVSGLVSSALILLYGLLTGDGVSTLRALVMFLAAVFAKILGRIYDPLSALSLSAILILSDSPAYLWDTAFLLSFGAVLGVSAVSPAMKAVIFNQEAREPKRIRRPAFLRFILCLPLIQLVKKRKSSGKNALAGSLSVFLTTLPIVLTGFGEVSLWGLLLNFVVLPFLPVVLLAGIGALAAGLLYEPAAGLLLLPGRLVLRGYLYLSQAAAALPLGVWIPGCPKPGQVAAYYALLAAGLFLLPELRTRIGENNRKKDRLLVLILLGLAVLILSLHPLNGLSVTCLDVGQGDCIIVQTKENACLLIDCGSTNKAMVGQHRLLPYLLHEGISYIDAIFVSHTDEDHINGIRELLEMIRDRRTAIRAGQLVLPDLQEAPEKWNSLKELAEEAGLSVTTAGCGDAFRTGNLSLRVLNPEKPEEPQLPNGKDPEKDPVKYPAGKENSGQNDDNIGPDLNENSLVLELEYGEFSALFTGDIGEETEKKLLPQIEDVVLLKTAHHGSRNSTCEAFLSEASPEIAVISCAEVNSYGHPAPETVARLQEAGAQVEYTMKSGAVTIWTDGKQYRTERFLNASAPP